MMMHTIKGIVNPLEKRRKIFEDIFCPTRQKDAQGKEDNESKTGKQTGKTGHFSNGLTTQEEDVDYAGKKKGG
jgi:hypothetical protein